ncbi:MAG TPA: LPS export ABC transporter permease LptF [Rhizobiaceae bacterium]|nr:LPS export ABC transporter permease LptF [Rhizobiaceae bacterium]
MNLIERYIFRRVLTMSLATFVSVLAIVWTTQALTRIDIATDSGASTAAFLKLIALLTPSLVPLVLPFALLIGIVQTLNTMNSDSEMAVISASGAPRSVVAKPILLIAFGAALFNLYSNHFIEPYSNRAVRNILTEVKSDLLSGLIREGVFTSVEKGLTVYVRRKAPGGELEGVMISDTRDPKLSLLYYAKAGRVGKTGELDLLALSDGEMHRKNTATGDISIIRYSAYAFDLSRFASSSGKTLYYPHEQTTAFLLNPDKNDPIAQKLPARYPAEFHRRMTDWFYPIVFAMIAIVVAGETRSNRQERFNSIALTFVFALFWRWLGFAAFNEAKNNVSLWPLVYAVPALALTVTGTMYAFHRTITVPDKVVQFFLRIWSFIKTVRAFLTPRRRATGGAAA